MTPVGASPRCPAVVTAAGHGTRFRPFTAVVPKEMLPVGGTPALGHVISECAAAGADRVYVVTRPGDQVVPAYARHLQNSGCPVECVPEDLACGYGNAAPLLTLRAVLEGCATFMVAFGDDVLLGAAPGADLVAMRQLAESGADAVIAAQLIDLSDVGSFGVIDVTAPGGTRVRGIRQRPDPRTVSDPLAVVSRLVLRPPVLARLIPRPEACGEVDLGIAVGEHAGDTDVRVHRITADWVTVGDPRRYYDALTRYWDIHQPTPAAREPAC
jgi:UTP--glucose-1-phosphate uridylyltransferase